jgi:hypothetical protein
MDTIAKKGRYYLLVTAILAWLGAFGIVVNQIVSVVLSNIVSQNLVMVLGTYNQFSAVVSALLGGAAPCVLLLLAAVNTTGRSKTAFVLFAFANGISSLLTLMLFFLRTPQSSYLMNISAAAIVCLFTVAGSIFLAADKRNCGTIKGIAVAAAVFALFTALSRIGANLCGYFYVQTYAHEPWVRLLSLASTATMFASIIAAVLDGAKWMLLFALPTEPEFVLAEPVQTPADEPVDESAEEPAESSAVSEESEAESESEDESAEA